MMKKIIRVIPFVVICIIQVFTWYIILSTENLAIWKHQVALGIAVGNLIAYFVHFNLGLLLTGILLLLATFNMIGLFPEISSTTYFIKIAGNELNLPAIQEKSFLLLVLYLIINGGYWMDQYMEFKSRNRDPR